MIGYLLDSVLVVKLPLIIVIEGLVKPISNQTFT
jgi:hypothetical protein